MTNSLSPTSGFGFMWKFKGYRRLPIGSPGAEYSNQLEQGRTKLTGKTMGEGEGNVKPQVSPPRSHRRILPQGTVQGRASRTSQSRAATGNAHNTGFSTERYSPRCWLSRVSGNTGSSSCKCLVINKTTLDGKCQKTGGQNRPRNPNSWKCQKPNDCPLSKEGAGRAKEGP